MVKQWKLSVCLILLGDQEGGHLPTSTPRSVLYLFSYLAKLYLNTPPPQEVRDLLRFIYIMAKAKSTSLRRMLLSVFIREWQRSKEKYFRLCSNIKRNSYFVRHTCPRSFQFLLDRKSVCWRTGRRRLHPEVPPDSTCLILPTTNSENTKMVLVDRKTNGFHCEICPEWK